MKLACRSLLCATTVKAAIISLALLSFAALPSFAADAPPQVMKQKMKQLMQKNPELMKEIMADPNHGLAMAYRKNLISFAKALKGAAKQGDTVPPEVARTAVDEMKRSVDRLEKQHSKVIASMPEEKRTRLGDLPALMTEHLADVKARIERLDKVVKADSIPSKAVMADLQDLFDACNSGMQGMHGGYWMDGGHRMMPHREMMEESEARDAELMGLVHRMNSASGAEKTDVMAEILTRMVKQRAEMIPPMHGAYPHGKNLMPRGCIHGCPCPCAAPSMNDDDDEDEGDEE